MFFIPFYAFNPELSIGNILTLAFNLGNKKWGITFGLLVVTYIILFILTVVTCGLGSLFFSVFFYLPIYLIYKEVVGFDEMDEIQEIGKIENL